MCSEVECADSVTFPAHGQLFGGLVQGGILILFLKKQHFQLFHHELFRGETAEHMLPADISTTIFHCNLLPH